MKTLAILCSDLHLSHTPPIARSKEPDWYGAMRRQLRELNKLAYGDIPVIIAGDLFDKPNPPPELINFAMRELPDNVYAVPGQHDLLHHNFSDMNKTAFGTLVEGGRVYLLWPDDPVLIGYLVLHGFPWGYPVKPFQYNGPNIRIAVIHSYIWTENASHPEASDSQKWSAYAKSLDGYDLAVFGDNHIPFEIKLPPNPASEMGCTIFNCGSFYRRHSNERKHRPSVGLLLESGEVKRHYLDVSEDKFENPEQSIDRSINGVEYFLDELKNFKNQTPDFKETLKHAMETRQISDSVRKLILEAMEK